MQRGERIRNVWQFVESPIYLGIGLTLIIASAGGLLDIWTRFIVPWVAGQTPLDILEILDQLLLISMLAEILQMVRISFTQRRLSSEPFLIVGLIAVVRRVLIITAEGTRMLTEVTVHQFTLLMAELLILAVLLIIFVVGIQRLRQQRLDEMRRLREEERQYGKAPSWAELLQGQ